MDFTFLIIMFLILLIPMFLMSRGTKKRMQQHQEMVRSIGVGDEVRTHSGFYGLVVEKFDDMVILEAEDGSQLKWAAQAIAQRVENPVDSAVSGVTVNDSSTETDTDTDTAER